MINGKIISNDEMSAIKFENRDTKDAIAIIRRLCRRFGFDESSSRVIPYMMLNQGPMDIEEIAKITSLSRTSVSTVLNRLESRYLISKEKVGRIGYYTLNIDFGRMIVQQPQLVLQNDLKPLISVLEVMYMSGKNKKESSGYKALRDRISDSARMLERVIKCFEKEANL